MSIEREMTMNIFETIRQDHEKQRTLVDLLIKTKGESDGRKDIWGRLKKELEQHAKAEERYFYAPLMNHDRTQEMARHSVAEHHELDELIEVLESTDMTAPKWLQTAEKLKEMLIHHLDEEEQEIFQQAGHALTEEEKSTLANQFRGFRNATD